MISLNGKDYSQRKPFSNPTKYQVGQIRKVDDLYYTITAIERVTDKQFNVYGYPVSQTIKLELCKEEQRQRELGRLNVRVCGKQLFVVKVD